MGCPVFLVDGKSRDSHLVPKKLTGEKKSSELVIIEMTYQAKPKNIFGEFVHEKACPGNNYLDTFVEIY